MPTLEIMESTVSGLVSAKFPSISALALSLVASVLLLTLIRAVFARLVTITDITGNADADEKGSRISPSSNSNDNGPSTYGVLSNWGWSWKWEGLPLSLPVSLSISEKDCPGVGVGVGVAAAIQQQQQLQPVNMTWQTRRRSPGFEPPLPALYDTQLPISMAKMIMSRHTYRRPSLSRPPPRVVPSHTRSVSLPSTRQLHSMV
jgi:hypothetical protein